MKKLILSLFLILSTLAFSQQPFRYDTIRVSKDDTRNIHQGLQQQQRQQQRSQQRASYAQTSAPKAGFDARNLRYGLNLSLNLNNDHSLFRFAPQVGYQFNKFMMAGAGVSYYYSKRKYYYTDETRHNNSLGGNLFAYLYPTSFLAFSVRPEVNYIWNSYREGKEVTYKKDVLVPSVVVGAGLRLGGRAHAMLYYDLVQDIDSPYTSGVFYGLSVYF